ncbi:hypothetical protein GCM10027258_81380 [Amycolatopsis stemonae]
MLIVWQGAGLLLGCLLAGLVAVALLAALVLALRKRAVQRQPRYPDYQETPVQKRVRTMRLRDRSPDATQPLRPDPRWTR